MVVYPMQEMPALLAHMDEKHALFGVNTILVCVRMKNVRELGDVDQRQNCQDAVHCLKIGQVREIDI